MTRDPADQMELNAQRVMNVWRLPSTVTARVAPDRLFLRDPALDAGDLGEHGYGPLYDHLQFALTPLWLRRYDCVGNHRNHGDKPARIGWREIAEPSAQVVVYPDWTFELDFDLYSVVRDARGGFFHFFGEWLWPRLRYGRMRPATDPFLVARLLREKRGIG